MTKSAVPHLATALDSLRVVVDRLPGNKEVFLTDGILQDATLMRLQEAGEQLVRVRDQFADYYE